MVDPVANKPTLSKTRKVFRTGFLLLVALPVALLLFEHFRGKRMLAVALGELRARSEVLDIARIAPPPVPAASNADRFVAATAALESGYERGPAAMQMIGPALAIAGSRRDSWVVFDGREQSWSDIADWRKTNAAAFAELHAALGAPYRRPVVDYSRGFDTLLPYLSPVKVGLLHLDAVWPAPAPVKDVEAWMRNETESSKSTRKSFGSAMG